MKCNLQCAFCFPTGGVLPHERAQVWQFLFGMYPSNSTALERPLIQEQMVVRYQVMKKKWQHVFPGAVHLQLNGTDGTYDLFLIPVIISLSSCTSHLQCNGHVHAWHFCCYTSVECVSFLFHCFSCSLWFLRQTAELVAAVEFFHQRQEHIQKEASQLSEEMCERMSFLELQTQVRKNPLSFFLLFKYLYLGYVLLGYHVKHRVCQKWLELDIPSDVWKQHVFFAVKNILNSTWNSNCD